ncbi:putative small nuclear ribonucleoprotein polypeptide A' [Besnoitia besnoiti]|uniref:Putative small nuclear ribonucleoprotein polypeptide A n=1 Tax=Besnoitia besnoiti TaxID=94643 RepID=A0A2A9MB43_BESBE|nr:putative small nuclear ribonucleoprotein polypeptide A' [Besnoitia besnoiti]PFH33146.1 putative small nuclear ribonucleoprotein polypeptide A' [Besnoitia besnoiti]
MRLTVDLILQSHQYINPARDWTLCLRGNKIPMIENLGATQDHFECIDLTDNELLKLENFPPLPRLRSLIVCNNRISRIDPEAIASLPGLTSLILTNNKIDVLSDLLPLFQAKQLERLSLVDNGVRERAYYRLFVIFNLPKLRFLDYKRVTQLEREQAHNTFKGEKGAKLAQQIAPSRKGHAALGARPLSASADESKSAKDTSTEHIERIKLAIAKATTMEEILRLETALRAGYIPDDLLTEEERKQNNKRANETGEEEARKK